MRRTGPRKPPDRLFFRSKFRSFFDVDFWSIWGRFGAPSWGHFGHFGRPRWAKIGPKRVLEAYQHPKRDVSPNTCPRVPERYIGAQDGSQNAPRSAQDGSKRLLKSTFFALENRLKFGLVLGAILADFGLPNGSP